MHSPPLGDDVLPLELPEREALSVLDVIDSGDVKESGLVSVLAGLSESPSTIPIKKEKKGQHDGSANIKGREKRRTDRPQVVIETPKMYSG
jgi:hypothetical protein